MSIRLTQLSHGGGCGCKIGPALLEQMLKSMPRPLLDANLLVGTETSDDAAVYRLNDHQALIATTDFFMPIVDDPFAFGRIAATNAISDIYAMGGQPIMGLAIVGMPVNTLPLEIIARILQGGASVAHEAGFQIAGGHSIDAPEPIYGLAVMGLAHPDRIKRNRDAQVGDALILTKPVGIGILATALKRGLLDDADHEDLVRVTTLLNKVGPALAELPGVHALTDVTGFGLAGHLLEVCRGSQVSAQIAFSRVPCLASAVRFAQQGLAPGATARNLDAIAAKTRYAPSLTDWQQRLLADPQTSGGLLISCAPTIVDEVLRRCTSHGAAQACVVGEVLQGPAMLEVLC